MACAENEGPDQSEHLCRLISVFAVYLYIAEYLDVEQRPLTDCTACPACILHKSIAGRFRPVSYPDGPITARCSFM